MPDTNPLASHSLASVALADQLITAPSARVAAASPNSSVASVEARSRIGSLRTSASNAIKTTVRTCTMPSLRPVITTSDRWNSSAMMTVMIMPNSVWKTS
jgi:hypothetical protein